MSDSQQSSDTVFGAIVRGEIPAEIVYEDEDCIAFRDLNPQAPVHVLVIPRIVISGLQEADQADPALLGHLMQAAQTVARQEGLETSGWRVVVNVGEAAGQTVPHLHMHVLGGRALTWPPG
ncbi:MAG: histidine triad nucleotide-binding protein [Chloroflexi bacterium]|nr:histidine triad nucleotide-binding protein [Chloroflexota bacterium]MYF81357.1 histidine triad nucleotide-binding protein [Chloroflexota bacterium]MYI04977.1 histidine triad nucleotide-binding protein [Chloroflexota bacterium]